MNKHFICCLMIVVLPLLSLAQSLTNRDTIDKRLWDQQYTFPDATVYLVAQLHNNQANQIIEKELLFTLNQQHNVTYDLLEYGHSLAFLINDFLETGDDSLLLSIEPTASFSFIRSIKAFNDLKPADKRIKFYGIDFEGRKDDLYLKLSFQRILSKHLLPNENELSILLTKSTSLKGPLNKELLQEIKIALTKQENYYRTVLQDYYLDLVLMTHSQYGFSTSRDGNMLNNFSILYNELKRTNPNPKFVGSFGTGHVNPKNEKGIAMRLLTSKQSPVLNKVIILGAQYINCTFGKDNQLYKNSGTLNALCSDKNIEKFVSENRTQNPSISYLNKDQLNELNCKKEITLLQGVFTIQNTIGTRFSVWD